MFYTLSHHIHEICSLNIADTYGTAEKSYGRGTFKWMLDVSFYLE